MKYLVTIKLVVSAENNTSAAINAAKLCGRDCIVETVKSYEQLSQLEHMQFEDDFHDP